MAAQPFATKERYGCGVPLAGIAGIAGIAGAISCRNYRVCTSLLVRTVSRFADGGDMSPPYKWFHDNDRWGSLSCHCNETPCRAGGRETARAGGQHELFSVSKKSPMCHCEERSDVAI